MNRDGRPDLAVAHADSSTVSVLFGKGDGSFHVAVSFVGSASGGISPATVAIGDVNGDGRLDLALATPATGKVSVLLNAGGPVTCKGLPATIVGTNATETIVGTPGNDVIQGLGGNDVIKGLGGKDVICGGSGNDKLFGGIGNDAMDGGSGSDLCDGGNGTDTAVRCERKVSVP